MTAPAGLHGEDQAEDDAEAEGGMMSSLRFYAAVFCGILRHQYRDMDGGEMLALWERLVREEPLPTEDAEDVAWQAWGERLTVWLDRLTEQRKQTRQDDSPAAPTDRSMQP